MVENVSDEYGTTLIVDINRNRSHYKPDTDNPLIQKSITKMVHHQKTATNQPKKKTAIIISHT